MGEAWYAAPRERVNVQGETEWEYQATAMQYRQATGIARQRTTSYYYTTYGYDVEMRRCCCKRNPRKRQPREYTTARGGDDPSEKHPKIYT